VVAAYGWPLEYILDLTVPQIRLLLKWKGKRERRQMLWQAQIAATAMFALAPEKGAEYLESISEMLGEDEAGEAGEWTVPASVPRLEALAERGGKTRLPIHVVQIKPEGTEVNE